MVEETCRWWFVLMSSLADPLLSVLDVIEVIERFTLHKRAKETARSRTRDNTCSRILPLKLVRDHNETHQRHQRGREVALGRIASREAVDVMMRDVCECQTEAR